MDRRPPRPPTSESGSSVLDPADVEDLSPEERRRRIKLVGDPPEADPEPISDGSAGRSWREKREGRRTERIRRFWSFMEGGNPHTNYWLVLGGTLALTAIGLTMVLSSSAVDSFGASGSAFTLFIRQASWAVIGLIGMLVVSRIPVRWMGGIGWVLMIVSGVLLALVAFTPLGHEVNGSRNWIQLGPINGQPSELAKLGLVLWGSAVLARKGRLVHQFLHWMMPFVMPGTLFVLLMVLIGGDLGTSLIILLMAGILLFTAGVRMRYFLVAAGLALAAVVALMWLTPYRMLRVYAWLGMNCEDVSYPCMQTQHGFYALASGGFWGVGLGQSRQKWSYIPEVENDFIFTIIGEELGLLGTLLVLGLFALLTLGIFRIAATTEQRFVRFACMGIAAWLVGQSFINIAMVTGIIPVVGVPLPFISYGGSALTCALLGVGVVLNFANAQRRRARTAPAERKKAATP